MRPTEKLQGARVSVSWLLLMALMCKLVEQAEWMRHDVARSWTGSVNPGVCGLFQSFALLLFFLLILVFERATSSSQQPISNLCLTKIIIRIRQHPSLLDNC